MLKRFSSWQGKAAHPSASLAVDLVVYKLDSGNFGVRYLLIRRKSAPFRGCLALPGGFVDADETAEEAAIRELKEETGITVPIDNLTFVKLSSAPDRDPRGRVISASYSVLVPSFAVAREGSDASSAVWLTYDNADRSALAFDHRDILAAARTGPFVRVISSDMR